MSNQNKFWAASDRTKRRLAADLRSPEEVALEQDLVKRARELARLRREKKVVQRALEQLHLAHLEEIHERCAVRGYLSREDLQWLKRSH